MTEKQYEKFRKSGKKIYRIWLERNRFHKEEVDVEKFDNSLILRSWLNHCNLYSASNEKDSRYVTEDQLDIQIRKYDEELRSSISEEIERLTKELERIDKSIHSAAYSSIIDDSKKEKQSK